MPTKLPPFAFSYRPKPHDYLPVVVASIRRHLGDWPIVLLAEERHLPPQTWLELNQIKTITDWTHSPRANKILRLWEHQEIFARHMESWIWWHDDMLLLKPLDDPASTFDMPLIAHKQRKRPNKELNNWQGWLWETLAFFRCQNIYAPNPVLHTPRLITRARLNDIPAHWNRKRLLFEPTYLLWSWHQSNTEPLLAKNFRKSVFSGNMPPIETLAAKGYTILNWGKNIDHNSARCEFDKLYPLTL